MKQPEAATTHGSQTAGDGAKRSRASTALICSPDTVLHHFETTGGHAVPPAPPAGVAMARSLMVGWAGKRVRTI
ncbi:MAG: hypothetical protein LBD24_09200 [Spirochaetaceae bacterium]|nr:hypothetical protein [Spirochaetaceae bacterium]